MHMHVCMCMCFSFHCTLGIEEPWLCLLWLTVALLTMAVMPTMAPLTMAYAYQVRIEEPPLVRVDGRLVRDGGEGTVIAVLDGWLRLRIPSEAAPLVLQLRARVDELFVGIVERPVSSE